MVEMSLDIAFLFFFKWVQLEWKRKSVGKAQKNWIGPSITKKSNSNPMWGRMQNALIQNFPSIHGYKTFLAWLSCGDWKDGKARVVEMEKHSNGSTT